MKVLFLSAWYPNRNHSQDGLFVQKHAAAAGRFNEVDVLFIKSEPGLKLPRGRHYEYVCNKKEDITEHIFYYRKPALKLWRLFKFFRIYREAFEFYCRQNGKPDIIHVNVLTRHGVMARRLQKRYGIPYVITEHWTRYFLQPFKHRRLHRLLTRHVVEHAARVLPVSYSLAGAMQECGLKGKYEVVRNVVDDFFFEPADLSTSAAPVSSAAAAPSKFAHTIIVVNAFNEAQKNNFGLLRAVKALSGRRSDFRVLFAGEGPCYKQTAAYAQSLGFEDGQAVFCGRIAPHDLKPMMDGSDFLVSFSNYETASVVLYESLACGKPVVTTNVDAIPEVINETNGMMVERGDEAALAEAMNTMLTRYGDYDAEALRKQARESFSYDVVGAQLDRIYREVCAEKPQSAGQ